MNLCACGCGQLVAKTWAPHHHLRKKLIKVDGVPIKKTFMVESEGYGLAILPLTVKPPEPSAPAEGPPHYPHPIDRSRWRLAEERPGTPQDAPWIKTQCHSCLLPMWTRDRLSTWENGGVCEECGFLFREDLGGQVAKRNGLARQPYDPFA